MARAIPCPCGDAICKNWLVDPPAYVQGVSFTKEQAEAVAALLNRESVSPYEKIAQIQKDLFEIRESMRDTVDDRTDSRFMRLCAELGTLAEDFQTIAILDDQFCPECSHVKMIHNEAGCTYCACRRAYDFFGERNDTASSILRNPISENE